MTSTAVVKETMTMSQFEARVDDGKFFTAEFTKRTNGEYRVMTCRRGVRKGVKGVGMAYDPKERDLLCVYDVQKIEEGKSEKGAFRMINLSDLHKVRLGGKTFNWDNTQRVFVEA